MKIKCDTVGKSIIDSTEKWLKYNVIQTNTVWYTVVRWKQHYAVLHICT